MRLGLLALVLLAGTANAEVFQCKAGMLSDEIVVVATGDADSDNGTIEVAGTVHGAEYSVRGFNRRWNFGSQTDQGIFSYAFVIKPDGFAHYYDFTLADEDGRANATQSFICVKEQAEIETEDAKIEAEDAIRQQELQNEAERVAAVGANVEAAYMFAIQEKVERNWVRPANVEVGLECVVNVRQLPGGEVVDVSLGRCNGDETVKRSIKSAVYKSSPLPAPRDPDVFDRSLTLIFKPKD